MKISLEELNELLKQLKNSQRDFSASVESAQDKAQAISDSHAMRGLTKGAINDFKTTTSKLSASAVI